MEDVSYIKLFRKLTKWEWYTEPNTFKLFIHILIKANYAEKKWRGIVIERGSFVTSQQKLSVETGLSIRSIRTALRNLEQTKEIEVKTTNKNTLIKALKYDFYQGYEVANDTQNDKQTDKQTTHQLTNERQTNDKQTTTTNNIKNIKNNKKYIYKGNSYNSNTNRTLPDWYQEQQNGVEEDFDLATQEEIEKMMEELRGL